MKTTNLITILTGLLGATTAFSDNPLVTHIFTADPTARAFDGTVYVYPSHDIDSPVGSNGFSMEDYHVFSSTDLMNFEDHGVILHQDDVAWAQKNNTMWAPDCIRKGANFYFYFPVHAIGTYHRIGVAVSSSPAGPFTPEPGYIPNANGIDPCIFIDDDGTPYLYFGGGQNDSLRVMRMQADMMTPDMAPQTLTGLGTAYKEGSFLFKRNGIYYFTYPYSPNGSEEIHYATGTSPLGPFTPQGTILPRWTDGCWTDHHSVLQYNGQWYLFYHHKDISGDQTLRSMCADRLYFNPDGSIQQVVPTRRGIGIRKADEPIQIDRYLDGSAGLTTPVFSTTVPSGFYLSGIDADNWISYPDVDFGTNGFAEVAARVASTGSGSIEVRVGSTTGPLLGTLPVTTTGGTGQWEIRTVALSAAGQSLTGLQNLYFVFRGTGTNLFNVDWVRFNRPNTAHLHFAGTGLGEVVINGTNTVKSFHPAAVIDAPAPVKVRPKADPGSRFAGWELNGAPVSSIASLYPGDEAVAFFNAASSETVIVHLEAENYSQQSGIQTSSGGSAVGYIENGDYIVFTGQTLSSAVEQLKARVASNTSGGTLSIHLDSLAAAAVATLPVSNTGGWTSWLLATASAPIPAGTYDIYVQFTGGAGYLFDIDWLQFVKPAGPEQTPYATWLSDNGITSATNFTDDADGDGISNLAEYALDFTQGIADSMIDRLTFGPTGISTTYSDKPDVDARLFYSTNLLVGWSEPAPSLTPGSMPPDTVYYHFDAGRTTGFYRWELTSP